ncbi:uncharacterized protein LOC120355241 [Nilaparvata lugens]|uniref:uncharacterized protein LOC120355241 n=1 Tax=Nilaparvata lugens TaxID=108931 RepID=UPI00193CC6A0|nr:uncharacterized protein LOC120355241 [Nilaparvata lugens]
MLYECGYISCIDRITRPNSNTCIDHFFIKLPFHFNACSFILQTSITDHFVIGLEVENNLLIEPSRNIDTQYSKIINWSGIDEALKVESWRRVVEAADVDEAAESFNEILQKNLEQLTTSERVCAKTKKIKPWITSGLLQSMRRRDKLSKEVRRNPYNNQLRQKFIRFRNTLKAAIKRSKYNYYKNKLSEAGGDSRKFWNVINEVSGRSTGKPKFPLQAYCERGGEASPAEIKQIASATHN